MKKLLFSFLFLQILCSGIIYGQLVETVFENDIEKAREMIQNGTDVNEKDEYDFYALYWAQYNSMYDFEEELKNLGAIDYNVELETFFNSCESGELETVKQLVEQGQDVNVHRVWYTPEDEGGSGYYCYETAICPAVRSGNIEVVKYLISAGAELNISSEGMQPLYEALSNNNYDMADYLIDQGADVNTNFVLNDSYYDLTDEDLVMLYYLMENNFIYSYSGAYSPLITAAEEGDFFKLRRYVQLSQNTEEFNIALCYSKTKDIAEFLLRNGADINFEFENYSGEGGCYDFLTPLISAVNSGDSAYVNYILSAGADVNLLDPYADTSYYESTECEVLSPLVHAVDLENMEIAEILVDYDANINWLINSPFNGYQSPLINAVLKNNEAMVRFLIEHGAEVVLGTVSALDFTDSDTSKEIIKYLEEVKKQSPV